MFQKQQAVFIYCISPVHMGAGTTFGLIDNPIQRERHTDYPIVAGSGLKGAIRHYFWSSAQGDHDKNQLINRIFGPETEASEYAGAISFSDAQIVTFPVRSVKKAFVYTTSPTVLARTERALRLAGLLDEKKEKWLVKEIKEGECLVVNLDLCLRNNRLPLESFEFEAKKDDSTVATIGNWLADHALPDNQAHEYFRAKLRSDLVVLSDEDFGFFVRNATVVEPHVRIDNVSGTADEGGLFYTENLPPETLLLSLALASRERSNNAEKMSAKQVLQTVLDGDKGFKGLDGRMIQIGGDATTGRGQVVLKAIGGQENA